MSNDYTQLKLDILNYALNNAIEPSLSSIIKFGQEEVERLTLDRGYGLSFMEKSIEYTPGIFKDTNTFQLPEDFSQMLYILPSDQLISPVITLSPTSGTLTASTYYYRVTAINSAGETLASQEKSITVGASAGVVITWTAITGATGYKVYGRANDNELYIATTTNTTYTDNGSITPSGAMPAVNTTGTVVHQQIDIRQSKVFESVYSNYIDKLNTGIPCAAKIENNKLVFDKYADIDYGVILKYYKKDVVLSDAETTNGWTDNAYELLLYSCLVKTAPFLGDDPRIKVWDAVFQRSLESIKTMNARERIAGRRIKTQVDNNLFFRK